MCESVLICFLLYAQVFFHFRQKSGDCFLALFVLVGGHESVIASDEVLHGLMYFIDHEFFCVSVLNEAVPDAYLFVVFEGGLFILLIHAGSKASKSIK